jgi:hypothetical protein
MPDEMYSVIFDMKAPLAPRSIAKGRSIPKVSSGVRFASSGGLNLPKMDSSDFKMPQVNMPDAPHMASNQVNGSSNVSLARMAPERTISSPKAEVSGPSSTSIQSSDAPLQTAESPQQGNTASNGGDSSGLAKQNKGEITPTPQPVQTVPQKQPTDTQIKPSQTHIEPQKNPKGTINGAPYDRKSQATQLPKAQKNAKGTINGEKPVKDKADNSKATVNGQEVAIKHQEKAAKGTINGAAPVKGEATQIPKADHKKRMLVNGVEFDKAKGTPTAVPKVDKTKRMNWEIVAPTELEKEMKYKQVEEEQNKKIEEYRILRRNAPTIEEIRGN